jgi:hypothetical protein
VKGVVFRKPSFSQLSLIVAIRKQLDVLRSRAQPAREPSGLTGQKFEVMTQICIHRFPLIGFLLIRAHFIESVIIESIIGRKRIGARSRQARRASVVRSGTTSQRNTTLEIIYYAYVWLLTISVRSPWVQQVQNMRSIIIKRSLNLFFPPILIDTCPLCSD